MYICPMLNLHYPLFFVLLSPLNCVLWHWRPFFVTSPSLHRYVIALKTEIMVFIITSNLLTSNFSESALFCGKEARDLIFLGKHLYLSGLGLDLEAARYISNSLAKLNLFFHLALFSYRNTWVWKNAGVCNFGHTHFGWFNPKTRRIWTGNFSWGSKSLL